MPPTNHALWLKATKDPVMTIDVAPYPTITPDALIIRTRAVAINPADWKLQQMGILLQKYPAILGCDAAGEVVEVGSNLTAKFSVGDRVFGITNLINGYEYAAFQEYALLKAPTMAKVPEGVRFEEAVVLPLGVHTAAACLFPKQCLGLAIPPSREGSGKVVIVWGASSSVGACGVQLAVASGYEVFGVASKVNEVMVKGLGARRCFDYRDANIVSDIVRALDGKTVVGAMDAISETDTLRRLCEVSSQVEGGSKLIASVSGAQPADSRGVSVVNNFQVDKQAYAQIATHLWDVFLPAAIADEKFLYKPDPDVVGHGLESVQAAVDKLSKGVSAKKLVVTI